MMKRLTFLTGNQNKLREARQILSGYEIVNEKIDLPEYQGDPHFIAAEKARLAVDTLKRPEFIDDTNLCFDALKGLPGPYIKDFLRLGTDGLVKILEPWNNKKAKAVALIAYCEPGMEPVVFEGVTHGTIVAPRGDHNFGWDPIFLPNGYDKTYAEMASEEKNQISHRSKALEAFKEYLDSQ